MLLGLSQKTLKPVIYEWSLWKGSRRLFMFFVGLQKDLGGSAGSGVTRNWALFAMWKWVECRAHADKFGLASDVDAGFHFHWL